MQESAPAQRKKVIEVLDNSDPLTNKDFKIVKPNPSPQNISPNKKDAVQ